MQNILIFLNEKCFFVDLDCNKKGCIPWVEQRNAMPHTAVLPLNYIHLLISLNNTN